MRARIDDPNLLYTEPQVRVPLDLAIVDARRPAQNLDGEPRFTDPPPIRRLKAVYGIRDSDVRVALGIVAANVEFLFAEWRRLHGGKGPRGE